MLKELKVRSYKILKKPFLTKQQKNHRVRFVKSNKNWSVKMWQSCIFTDESCFEIQMFTGGNRVRRLKGKNHRFTERNTRRQLHFPKKLMIWASIGKEGVGKIIFLKNNERMNSQIYAQILQKVISGEMK